MKNKNVVNERGESFLSAGLGGLLVKILPPNWVPVIAICLILGTFLSIISGLIWYLFRPETGDEKELLIMKTGEILNRFGYVFLAIGFGGLIVDKYQNFGWLITFGCISLGTIMMASYLSRIKGK
jgi:hypothetical protein